MHAGGKKEPTGVVWPASLGSHCCLGTGAGEHSGECRDFSYASCALASWPWQQAASSLTAFQTFCMPLPCSQTLASSTGPRPAHRRRQSEPSAPRAAPPRSTGGSCGRTPPPATARAEAFVRAQQAHLAAMSKPWTFRRCASCSCQSQHVQPALSTLYALHAALGSSYRHKAPQGTCTLCALCQDLPP